MLKVFQTKQAKEETSLASKKHGYDHGAEMSSLKNLDADFLFFFFISGRRLVKDMLNIIDLKTNSGNIIYNDRFTGSFRIKGGNTRKKSRTGEKQTD